MILCLLLSFLAFISGDLRLDKSVECIIVSPKRRIDFFDIALRRQLIMDHVSWNVHEIIIIFCRVRTMIATVKFCVL